MRVQAVVIKSWQSRNASNALSLLSPEKTTCFQATLLTSTTAKSKVTGSHSDAHFKALEEAASLKNMAARMLESRTALQSTIFAFSVFSMPFI